MSQANVEIVRSFLKAGVDEALEYADPGIVWNPIEELPTQGHDAVRASLAHWKADWDDYSLVPEEFADMGEQIVVTVRLEGRGRGSGVAIDARFYDVYRLRDGKIVRMDQFTERSEALRAVSQTSQENVELWRRWVEDFLAGTSEADREAMIASNVARLDPEVVWDASELPLPDIGGRIYEGREAVRGFWREWLAAWETTEFEYELVGAGERVVLLLDQRVRGRSTGIEVSVGKFAQVATFKEGLIVHWKLYASPAEALEAVGLPG